MDEKTSGFSIEPDETELNEILNQTEDVSNSNIEVVVKNEFPLGIVVGTPKNLQYLMEKNKVNFYDPGLPWIIVPTLTKEIISEAIKAYLDNEPDRGFSIELDETRLNQIEDVSNSNIEVVVRNEYKYPFLRIAFGTPKNLQYLMEKNKVNFYDPVLPWIIVPQLTKEIIYEAIKAYLDNEPDRGFSIELDETRLNQIEDVSNSIIEVVVRVQDRFTLRIAVGTPDSMENKVNLCPYGLPWIIVPQLTKEIIYEAIKDYFDTKLEGYSFKVHFFELDIDRDDQDDYDYSFTYEFTEDDFPCPCDDKFYDFPRDDEFYDWNRDMNLF